MFMMYTIIRIIIFNLRTVLGAFNQVDPRFESLPCTSMGIFLPSTIDSDRDKLRGPHSNVH
jgi:hypothetical protein